VTDRRSVLLLSRTTRQEAGNVRDHVRALETCSRHDVMTFDPVDHPRAAARLDLDEFDVVVVHYTIPITIERYLSPVLAEKLARFRGLKVQFIQDEYRWVDAVTARMRDLGIDVLFTCVPERELSKVYGARVPDVRLVPTLPGFVPDELADRRTPPLDERPVDVGYRGRTVPMWLGRLGHEKQAIGHEFAARAARFCLRCDISSSEDERIYGEEWNRFLQSCRATLGTESGASIADFDGAVEARVRGYLVRHPEADFEEVERAVLAPYEGNVVINTVSSRIFEAAALRTAMILFPGEYSGAVEPWTHYIPLEKDFSNMELVAASLRDLRLLQQLTDRAYDDLVASGRYSLRRFVREFDEVVARESGARSPAAKPAYRRARLRRRLSMKWALAPARRSAGRAVQPLAIAVLRARDPAVRELGRAAPRSHSLDEDLWRLAALRRAVARGLFHVAPSMEDGGRRLVLTSRPRGEPRGALLALDDVRRVLEGHRLRQLVWDHGAVGDAVPLLGSGFVPTLVGDDGVPGAYAFGPLIEQAHARPSAALTALAPFLAESTVSVRPQR
jgi:hypothetical protein